MSKPDRILRWTGAGCVLLSLSACEPKKIDIKACMFAGKLAFEVADTAGWFSKTTARPWAITVVEPFAVSVWNTSVPHDLIEDSDHTFQPQRNIILYGVSLSGWDVVTKPQALKLGVDYQVEIWSDGGRGRTDIKEGGSYPTCDPVKAFDQS